MPGAMRALAEMNLVQSRQAYEQSKNALEAALETLGRSFDAVGQGATALNHKIIDMAHRNIGSSFDLAKSLAAAKNLADAAPFYGEMESPVPPGGLPHPGLVLPSLPNNHFQYALTWFGLAAVLIGVYAAWMFGRWRGRE